MFIKGSDYDYDPALGWVSSRVVTKGVNHCNRGSARVIQWAVTTYPSHHILFHTGMGRGALPSGRMCTVPTPPAAARHVHRHMLPLAGVGGDVGSDATDAGRGTWRRLGTNRLVCAAVAPGNSCA